jgi:hypothetical protein
MGWEKQKTGDSELLSAKEFGRGLAGAQIRLPWAEARDVAYGGGAFRDSIDVSSLTSVRLARQTYAVSQTDAILR